MCSTFNQVFCWQHIVASHEIVRHHWCYIFAQIWLVPSFRVSQILFIGFDTLWWISYWLNLKPKENVPSQRTDSPDPLWFLAVLYLFNIVSTLSRAWILSMWRGVGSRKLCAEGIQGRWWEKFVSEVARRAGASQAGRRKKGEDAEEGEEEEGEEEKKHKREQVCRRERQERDETEEARETKENLWAN